MDVLSGSLSDKYNNVIHHRPRKLLIVNPEERKHCAEAQCYGQMPI